MRYLLLSVLTCLLIVPTTLADHHENDEPSPDAAAMAAQEAWAKATTPGPQHAEMAKMTGTFKLSFTSWMSPDAEPMVSEGTATRTLALGGRVLEETVESNMMGLPFKGVARTGYDNISGKWWSTWTDNMSTALLVMHGDHDAESGTMTLSGMAPTPMNPAERAMMTVVTTVDDSGKEVSTFHMGEGDDKYRYMVITYERQ